MSSKATSDYRRRRKLNLVRICGNKCAICGYNKCISALDFHHLNPQEKLYNIASNGSCRDLETDIAEIRKCILVCANCHREIHSNMYSLEQLKSLQYIDENIIEELRNEKCKLLTKTQYFCKNCNKEITKYSESSLCEQCSKIAQRKVIRPSREELKQLIRTIPFTRIAEQFGVSDNAIRKWCKAENLPSKKSEINQYSVSEWEKI